MVFNNSINANTPGIVGVTSGGVWTGTAVTQYNVIVGGAATDTLANVAPSATAGIALVSGGAAVNPSFSTVVVAGGGTGLTSLTAYELLCGGTTSTANVQQIALGTSGQVLTSNGAGALASYQTFTPSSQSPYLNVTGATQAMAVNTGYVTNDPASLVTYTPPASCAVGTIFAIVGNSADGWTIDLAANSQTINFGSMAATTALASSNQYDGVKFVCTVANTSFSVASSQGNLTVS
jgi:hypothetical protein